MTNKSYKVETFSGLSDLPGKYLCIFDKADKNLFYSLGWFRNYENTIIPDANDELVYVVNKAQADDAECDSLAICLAKIEKKSATLFDYHITAPLANYYSTYYNVLIDEETESRPVIETLVGKLDDEKGNIPVFNMGPVVEDDGIAHLLDEEFRKKGWFTYYYKMFGNWRLQVNDRSFEDYYQTVPSRIRNTIKRKEKKLIKEHEVDYRLYSGPEGVEKAISSFNEVYNSSWKVQEPYPEFISGLVKVSAENGWLRMGVLDVDKQAVAAQLWIVKDDVAYIYKLAYTEESKKLSAGSILTRNLMQHVIDTDKVKIIDYLTGDDAYKKDWMSERRQMVGLMAYSNTYKGKILTLFYRAKRLLKSMLKSSA